VGAALMSRTKPLPHCTAPAPDLDLPIFFNPLACNRGIVVE
jgi:hypothetical protein